MAFSNVFSAELFYRFLYLLIILLTNIAYAQSPSGNPLAPSVAPMLEVSYPDGPLKITGSTKSKPSWKLPAKLGKGKDTLMVLLPDARGSLLQFHSKANIKNLEDSTTIEVPPAYSTKIHAGKGGLKLSKLEGKIEGKAESGPITLDQVKGEVHCYTKEGAVKVTGGQVSGMVGTGKGDVVIENVAGPLIGYSQQGKVIRRYTAAYFKDQKKEAFKTGLEEGELEVETLPEGGELMVQKGKVTVKGSSKDIKVTLQEGDIDIKGAQAGVKATTRKGNLSVSIDKKPSEELIELVNSQGETTIYLPSSFSGLLQVGILASTAGQTYRIENDFQGKLRAQWPYTKGVPEENQPGAPRTTETKDRQGKVMRREITLSQQIGTGKRVVRIHAENGNVTIKKLP